MPDQTHNDVKRILISNLKHILVGLEMKAALIQPHQVARANNISLLFEPYSQIMTFEYCVGVFSVCEALGSIYKLSSDGGDGSQEQAIARTAWQNALVQNFDTDGTKNLSANVEVVTAKRDKIHQDRIGARCDIDWHEFSFDAAFTPASNALKAVLQKNSENLPDTTNLND